MRKFLLIICIIPIIVVSQSKVKVACIGNSITEGFANYPTSLRVLLGPDYEVGNFGNWGHTLVIGSEEDQKENPAYMDKQKFIDALDYQPNIVIIKLGSNDSKTWFWNKYKSQYENDLRLMISKFQELESNPRVILCRPIPAHNDGVFGINDKNIREDMTAILQNVAGDLGLTLVDAYGKFRALKNLSSYYAWDGIHLNYKGGHQLALVMYEGIKGHEFVMNPGGLEILSGNLQAPAAGVKKELGIVEFGSLPTYSIIEIQTADLTDSDTGSYSVFLDNETEELVHISLSNIDKDGKAYALFNREITDKHTVSILWNNQSVALNSLLIKEKFKPFNPEIGKVYYIINKETKQALTVDGASMVLSEPDSKSVNQQFYFDEFSYGTYLIQTAADKEKNIKLEGSNSFTIKEDVSSSSVMKCKAIDDGWYVFGTNELRRFGLTNAHVLRSNKKDASITNLDMWRFVKREDLSSSSLNDAPITNINMRVFDRNLIIQCQHEREYVLVADILGKVQFSGMVDAYSTKSIALNNGIYIVKTGNQQKKPIKIIVK